MPDGAVAKVELALETPNLVAKQIKTAKDVTLPPRPAYGNKGNPVTLRANYMVLSVAPKLVLYRYDVSVSPPLTGSKLEKIVGMMLKSPDFEAHKDDICDRLQDGPSFARCASGRRKQRANAEDSHRAVRPTQRQE